MNVPKWVKDSAVKSAYHRNIANNENEKIRNWLINNNLYNDAVLDCLIDSIETTNTPNDFINYLEQDAIIKGNERI